MKFKMIQTGSGAIQQRRVQSGFPVKSINSDLCILVTSTFYFQFLKKKGVNERRGYVVKCCGSASCINPIMKTQNGTAISNNSKGMEASKRVKEKPTGANL
jgi:hypothetical protein